MSVQVYVRGADRRTVGPPLSAWKSLSVIFRRNEVGPWVLRMPPGPGWDRFVPGTGILIQRNGETIESGCWWTPKERNELGVSREGTVGGWNDTVIMHDALCWPQPTQPIGSQTDTPFATAVNSPAANRIRALFQANVINRQAIPGAAVEAASGLGKQGRSLVMMDNLLEHAQEICAKDVNFWVRQRDSDRALVLQFRAPRDVRQSARFSPQAATVKGWTTADSGPEVQEVILAAGEEGSRVFRRRVAASVNGLVGSRVTDWGGIRRIERFVDGSGMNPADPLFVDQATERMDDELIGGRRRQSLKIDVTTTLPFRGPLNRGGFDVGDLARAYISESEYVEDLIEQVEWTVDAEGGERFTVWVGPVNDPDEHDADREKRLRLQVNRLMRRP